MSLDNAIGRMRVEELRTVVNFARTSAVIVGVSPRSSEDVEQV